MAVSSDYKYIDLPDIDIENPESIELYINVAESIFKRNKVKHDKVEIPKFDNPVARVTFEMEEVRRCRDGYNGLSGIMYFYLNYCYIVDAKRGLIRPDFWYEDQLFFDLIMSCNPDEINAGSGVICVKRRRGGFSWKIAAFGVWSSLFRRNNNTGMTSKTERDAQYLFQKCKSIYEKLPTYLKHPLSSSTQEGMVFARAIKDDLGNKKLEGNQSELIVKAPVDTAFEGLMLNYLIIDELGKINNAESIWSMSEPCLMSGTERVGVPIMFGTAGEQDGMGAAQRKLWNRNEDNNLIKFFFAGWSGMFIDEYGNPDIRKAVLWICEKRSKTKDKKKLIDFIQQYPLNIREAFLSSSTSGIGNTINVMKQIQELERSPKAPRAVRFRHSSDGANGVVADPNMSSDCLIYEEPSAIYRYVAGCDPADHNYTTDSEVSLLSMYIMRIPNGAEAPVIVFSYTCRPDRVEDFYDNSILALTYYNNCKVLIENNRYGMIQHFELGGFHTLLRHEPAPRDKFVRTAHHTLKIGIRKGVSSTQEMERVINQYTDTYCDLIPDLELLNEFQDYGLKNTDRVVAFGWTLVALEDDLYTGGNKKKEEIRAVRTKLKKVNGIITRIKE